jgi:hypothetical protein
MAHERITMALILSEQRVLMIDMLTNAILVWRGNARDRTERLGVAMGKRATRLIKAINMRELFAQDHRL